MKSSRPFVFSAPAVLSVIVVLGIVGYVAVVTSPFVKGPAITVSDPKETAHGTTLIEGMATRVSSLSVNDMEIPLTETGAFSVEQAYPAGYTVVVLRAKDRFGRVREKTLTFITHHIETQSYGTEEKNDTENDH